MYVCMLNSGIRTHISSLAESSYINVEKWFSDVLCPIFCYSLFLLSSYDFCYFCYETSSPIKLNEKSIWIKKLTRYADILSLKFYKIHISYEFFSTYLFIFKLFFSPIYFSLGFISRYQISKTASSGLCWILFENLIAFAAQVFLKHWIKFSLRVLE